MSSWAKDVCTFWLKGHCKKGISCTFRHDGIPITEGRCYICGQPGHSTAQCTAPGGGQDPDKDKH